MRWAPISTLDQFRQLCDRPRTVYLTFDVDANGSGQQAAQALAHRLRAQGITTRRVLLPPGHDPNSFFVQGGDARQFHSLLEAAPLMRFHVIRPQTPNPAQSPLRVVEHETGREVGWVNRYLDREYVRRLADTTSAHPALTTCCTLFAGGRVFIIPVTCVEGDLTESTLLDYVKFQCSHQPPFSGSTINDRVAVADRALRNEFPDAP